MYVHEMRVLAYDTMGVHMHEMLVCPYVPVCACVSKPHMLYLRISSHRKQRRRWMVRALSLFPLPPPPLCLSLSQDQSCGAFKINVAVRELPNFLCCPNSSKSVAGSDTHAHIYTHVLARVCSVPNIEQPLQTHTHRRVACFMVYILTCMYIYLFM